MNRIVIPAFLFCFCILITVVHAQSDEVIESDTTKKFTSNHEQLTTGPFRGGYPDWSPDGRYIVYSSNKNLYEGFPEGDLWIIPADGGYPLRLTQRGGHHGVFSPDGKQVVYDAERGSEVRVIPSSGGEWTRIVPEEINVEHSGNPCWSPDGTKIAFRAFDELMILDLASGDIESVYQRDKYKPMPIQWSKKDDCILVANVSPELRDGDLWKIPLDGNKPQQMTFHKMYVSQATVSPDERFILFSSIEDEKAYQLYVIPWEGGRELKITDDPWHYVEPCWCPVDNRVVCVTLRTGWIDLWIIDLNVDEIENALKTQSVF